jgi:hypothetical protein
MAAHHEQLLAWAVDCPTNFVNRAALVGAELARMEGRDLDAMRSYDEAIRSARANDFVHNEAPRRKSSLWASSHSHLRGSAPDPESLRTEAETGSYPADRDPGREASSLLPHAVEKGDLDEMAAQRRPEREQHSGKREEGRAPESVACRSTHRFELRP